jgi:hypothetical protein
MKWKKFNSQELNTQSKFGYLKENKENFSEKIKLM